MDFEKGDYLINLNDLKVKYFDALMELSPTGEIHCEFEEIFQKQIAFIQQIEELGTQVGE